MELNDSLSTIYQYISNSLDAINKFELAFTHFE